MKKAIAVLVIALGFVAPLLGARASDEEVVPTPSPTDVCPPACSVVGLEFLGPNQNLNPANFIPQVISAPAGTNLVHRLGKDFYFNGRHIELPEFKDLKINADWVADGATVRLEDVTVR